MRHTPAHSHSHTPHHHRLAAPDTSDERVINTGQKVSIFKQHENLTLAINSAKVMW